MIHKEEELEIHRLKRGGEYRINNMMVLCKECHKSFHANEFRGVKSQ